LEAQDLLNLVLEFLKKKKTGVFFAQSFFLHFHLCPGRSRYGTDSKLGLETNHLNHLVIPYSAISGCARIRGPFSNDKLFHFPPLMRTHPFMLSCQLLSSLFLIQERYSMRRSPSIHHLHLHNVSAPLCAEVNESHEAHFNEIIHHTKVVLFS